jgi:hypothetical protein
MIKANLNGIIIRFWALLLALTMLVVTELGEPNTVGQGSEPKRSPSGKANGRDQVPQRWWESAPAIMRVHLKAREDRPAVSLDPAKASAQLDEIREAGFTVIEIFAPAEGGNSFGGLDTINRYRIDPALGTMDDFQRLVRLAHSKGMAVITFDNLGYCSVEASDFLKACDDVKAGRDSKEARFFLWRDKEDAQPPGNAPGDTFFMVRPTHLPGAQPGTFYDSSKHEFWQYSERAGKYYWTKWAGVDSRGSKVRLPQYNWGSREFQEEAEKIVRFWMETGIDGMIIDAVNWYVDHTWEKGRRRMTEVIASYGNTYSQPEGGGGFHEDPVAWITEGGWNSVQDYGLGIWWEKGSDVIESAINSGDPRPIERVLRDYHDRVVAAGGVLYHFPPRFKEPEKQALALAVVACAGDLVAAQYPRDLQGGSETKWLLGAKRTHPALQQLSARRHLPTRADHKYYAFLRTAADRSERILVVMNFQPSPQTIDLDTSGLATTGLVEMRSNSLILRRNHLELELPAYGYRLYKVQPEANQ